MTEVDIYESIYKIIYAIVDLDHDTENIAEAIECLKKAAYDVITS